MLLELISDFFMPRILPNLIAGLHKLCENRNLILVLIIAEEGRDGILAGYNIFGRKSGESQCTDIGHAARASADIVLS